MRGWKTLPVLLVLLLTASTSFAAGFRLPQAGAKAMGMGFAFTAQADDPSAIYFNPAGLTQLKGQNIMFGVTYVRENGGEFTGTTPVDNTTAIKNETQKSLNFYIPNAYYTRTTNSGDVSYGVGIYAPFGLGQVRVHGVDGALELLRQQVAQDRATDAAGVAPDTDDRHALRGEEPVKVQAEPSLPRRVKRNGARSLFVEATGAGARECTCGAPSSRSRRLPCPCSTHKRGIRGEGASAGGTAGTSTATASPARRARAASGSPYGRSFASGLASDLLLLPTRPRSGPSRRRACVRSGGPAPPRRHDGGL